MQLGDIKTSSIRLEWKKRTGAGGRTERDFRDFVIDGQSLHEQIGGDLVSCLGWLVPDGNDKAVRRLLRKEAADFPGGRVSLYVCGECGELDCGAISVVVEREGERIIWRDFGFGNNQDDELRLEDFVEVGPFAFDATDYYQTISQGLVNENGR